MSGAVAVGSDDDTLADGRKKERVTGRTLRLIGDNLQHCPGQRVLVHFKGKKVEQFVLIKMKDLVRQGK